MSDEDDHSGRAAQDDHEEVARTTSARAIVKPKPKAETPVSSEPGETKALQTLHGDVRELFREWKEGKITEAVMVAEQQQLEAANREGGEEALCRTAAKTIPAECNPDGTVKR